MNGPSRQPRKKGDMKGVYEIKLEENGRGAIEPSREEKGEKRKWHCPKRGNP